MPEIAGRRYTALDVFRGMTICFMIIVNTPGNKSFTFGPLLHADWNGFTPTDLVYPSFLFAVGNALSFAKIKWQSKSNGQVVFKILSRTLLIFIVGFILGWSANIQQNGSGEIVFPSVGQARIFGVLQRIALVYCMTALMAYFLSVRTIVIISVGLLVLYWSALLVFTGSDGPYSIIGNAVRRFDLRVLGAQHMYMEGNVPFEPEGLLSTFPAVVNVVAGMMMGSYLQRRGSSFEVLFYIMLAGCMLMGVGYFWDLFMPFNKKLWTSSFVVLAIGLDCLILVAIIYFIDFRQVRSGVYFFQVFGRNPLFIYLLAEAFEVFMVKIRVGGAALHEYLYDNVYRHVGAYTGSLLFAMTVMLLCWNVGYVLDRNRIYVRV